METLRMKILSNEELEELNDFQREVYKDKLELRYEKLEDGRRDN